MERMVGNDIDELEACQCCAVVRRSCVQEPAVGPSFASVIASTFAVKLWLGLQWMELTRSGQSSVCSSWAIFCPVGKRVV
eukprot:4407701-Amphidinium_carterae.1